MKNMIDTEKRSCEAVMTKVGEIMAKSRIGSPRPKNYDIYKFDDKKSN